MNTMSLCKQTNQQMPIKMLVCPGVSDTESSVLVLRKV